MGDKSMHAHGYRREGFTVVELLVVVAIIAIVAAILFPVLVAVKDRGRQSACQSNLRQLTSAMLLYVQDNSECWPGPDRYTQSTLTYTRNRGLYKCPSDARTAEPIDDGGLGKDRVSYMCNSELYRKCDAAGCVMRTLKMSGVVCSTAFILLVDDSSGDGSMNACWGSPHQDYSFYRQNQAGRHAGGDNYAFADGHAKWLRSAGIPETAVTYLGVTWDPEVRPHRVTTISEE